MFEPYNGLNGVATGRPDEFCFVSLNGDVCFRTIKITVNEKDSDQD